MDRETARVEAFSDGVFAIAITLLIIEIKAPHGEELDDDWKLFRALFGLWPSFLAFVLSFGTILIMWINHHGLFRYAGGADNRLFFSNGILLMTVTFLPFPTAVLAEHLDREAGKVAATFYCGSLALVSVAYNLTFWSVLVNRKGEYPPHLARALVRIRTAYRLGLVAYLVATGISLWHPVAGIVLCFALWPMWALLRYMPTPKDHRRRPGEHRRTDAQP